MTENGAQSPNPATPSPKVGRYLRRLVCHLRRLFAILAPVRVGRAVRRASRRVLDGVCNRFWNSQLVDWRASSRPLAGAVRSSRIPLRRKATAPLSSAITRTGPPALAG